jgi:hypothetical protein
MYPDQIGLGNHLDVIRATTAHPAVVDANDGKTVGFRLCDRHPRGVVHRQHANVVATVVKRRNLSFSQ